MNSEDERGELSKKIELYLGSGGNWGEILSSLGEDRIRKTSKESLRRGSVGVSYSRFKKKAKMTPGRRFLEIWKTMGQSSLPEQHDTDVDEKELGALNWEGRNGHRW